MCGIAGWCGERIDAPEPRLKQMLQTIVHRGPDEAGIYLDGAVALGMRRLSIIDLATGSQPIGNEDGQIQVVFNGEIYNFRDLRDELVTAGHVFRTHSDTEVIVHAYEEWGDDFVVRLNGIFAFALWDRIRNRLLLARDHFGVKPLYYSWDGRRLLFASEIKAFRPWGLPSQVDREGLALALTLGYVPSPFTLFQGVRKLGPGHTLTLALSTPGIPEERRYWWPSVSMMRATEEDEIVEGLRARLDRAVERQMMSDVPIGALLSGGVDSTAVVTLMRRHSDEVRTFSIGIKDAPEINELAAARDTARRLGTRHFELEIGSAEYTEFLPTAYSFLEEPCTPSSLLTYFVCKLARESVKVVLTGQGADEIFAGYPRYVGERYGGLFRRLPDALTHRGLPYLADWLRAPLRIQRGITALAEPDPMQRFRRIHQVFSSAELAKLWPDLQLSSLFDPVAEWSEQLESRTPLEKLLYIDARTSLSDNLLLFGDKMSMATSVEARVPFLDLELAEYAEAIPGELRIRRGQKKYILRRALKGLVPDSTLAGKKLGFQIPEVTWFRGPLHDYLSDLLGANAVLPRYLDRARIAELLELHRRGVRNMWRQLFTLLSIELCCRALLPSGG
jgi:asparagine synthase (glutamine-hydrolysing)